MTKNHYYFDYFVSAAYRIIYKKVPFIQRKKIFGENRLPPEQL